jgi:formylglycine-generating enzyme required for sulfatase activity
MKGNVLEWGWDQDASHLNSMVDYRVNGAGYFFEKLEAIKNNAKGFHKEYTGAARSIIGFRVAKGKPE